jgi:hypothetical protein
MKITVNVDTTPEELRTFLGLPDVSSLQNEMLEKIREQMMSGVEGYDPATLLRPMLPDNLKALEALQQQFWKSFFNPGASSKSEEK